MTASIACPGCRTPIPATVVTTSEGGVTIWRITLDLFAANRHRPCVAPPPDGIPLAA